MNSGLLETDFAPSLFRELFCDLNARHDLGGTEAQEMHTWTAYDLS